VLSRPSLIEAFLDSGKFAAARQLLDGVSADEQAKNGFYKLYACKLKRLKGESAAVVAEAAELKALSEKVKADDAALASRLWVELALSQLETGDTKSSAASANKALELYGKNFAAYLALAKAQMADGKFVEAEDSCAKAAKLNIYFAQTYFVQGQVQLKAGKNKEGIESLKRACELYPGFREAHKLLLVTYKQLAMDKDAKLEESLLTRMDGKRGR
jgi:tetratricopeptide (TPR) repeat protein